MILELIDTLRQLDRYVGHYPIYLYLIDDNNKVVWFNQYMSEKLPALHVGRQLRHFRELEMCDNGELINEQDRGSHAQLGKNIVTVDAGDGAEMMLIDFFSLPVMDKDGQPEGVLRLGLDVTSDEKLRERLREKENLFTAIINSSADAVIFVDDEGMIKSWNRGAESIFGYSEAEITGEPIEKLVPEELIELGELGYIREELTSEGALKKFETQRQHKDGRLIYVDISSTRIFNAEGTYIGTSEIIKDITARKQLEFELLRTILELSKLNELNEILHRTYEEREILRIILIAITAGEGLRFNRAFVLMIDEDHGMLNGTLAIGPSDQEEANRIWSELNQDYRDLKEIVNIYKIDLEGADRKVNEIVTRIEVPLDAGNQVLMQAMTNMHVLHVKGGECQGIEQPDFSIGDTSLIDILQNDTFVVAPLFSRQERLGVIIADNCINKREITNEDIEGLKIFASQASGAIENARLYQSLEDRIEELQAAYKQLAENQERLIRAERLAAIGEMSAKVAHEIRNPLVSIGGFARLIERKIEDGSESKKFAGIIREQVLNLEQILNNILNAANPPKPQRKHLHINDVVEQTLRILDNAIEKRHITLVRDLGNFPEVLMGDEKQLHQVLLNLLKNAIEALDGRPSDGEICITTRCTDDGIEMSVRDNGLGMETGMLQKIFQTFFTTKSSGTGLGLPIVEQIVKEHNGSVDVESQPEQGTTFVLRFPAAVTEAVLEA